jgi:hypothetical protein
MERSRFSGAPDIPEERIDNELSETITRLMAMHRQELAFRRISISFQSFECAKNEMEPISRRKCFPGISCSRNLEDNSMETRNIFPVSENFFCRSKVSRDISLIPIRSIAMVLLSPEIKIFSRFPLVYLLTLL